MDDDYSWIEEPAPEPTETVSGRMIGMPDGSYEVLAHGCYRRLPANPGNEGE